MLYGLVGRFAGHLDHAQEVIGRREGASTWVALNAVLLDQHTLFIADTFVNVDSSAEQLADIAEMAGEVVARFGVQPRVAFLSHSMFGSCKRPSARKMQHGLAQHRGDALGQRGAAHQGRGVHRVVRGVHFPAHESVLVMPT